MSAKHTPGPWLQVIGRAFVFAFNSKRYNRFSVHVEPGHDDDEQRTSVAELEANARLIAAAPDMLEALEEALFTASPARLEHPTMFAAWEKMSAAIAKAKGEA